VTGCARRAGAAREDALPPSARLAAPTRRTVVTTGCAVACTALLGACSSSVGGSGARTGEPAVAPVSPATGSSEPVLARTDQIPVGGGMVFPDHGVVVVRPTASTVKAWSATCTHQGCTVTNVTGGAIICPCHGSTFSVADGSVITGPATQPLAARRVTVSGTAITL
jgi:Rieske Fe-S protein